MKDSTRKMIAFDTHLKKKKCTPAAVTRKEVNGRRKVTRVTLVRACQFSVGQEEM